MTQELQPVELTAVDTNAAEWVNFPVPELGVDLELMPLIADPDTGMQVFKTVYRAGFTNIWHTHPCAHGFYVLEGTLRTHQGEYGPGSFVWFPEGGVMQHGATDDADCVFLFITNKPFGIHYPGKSAPEGNASA
jgi:quercetin dioxygenase-like cupin family protein